MRRSSCVSTWASREAGTSQNERRHGMLHRGVLHSAMPGMIPCVSSSHAPWWHVSRWEGHASWFRGHAARWLPHGNQVKLAAPTTKRATTQQTCIVGEDPRLSQTSSYYWEHASGVSAWQEPQTFAGYWKRIFDEYRMLISGYFFLVVGLDVSQIGEAYSLEWLGIITRCYSDVDISPHGYTLTCSCF